MPCSGYPSSCSGKDEYLCEICGCDWDWEFESCKGTASSCATHGDINDCEDCGCSWAEPGVNIKVNIGDVWKDVSEIKLNVGDTWKTVTEIWINIGDVWKRVF